MQDVIDDIATRSGLSPEVAGPATSLVAHYLTLHLTTRTTNQLRAHVPALDDLSSAGRVHAETLAARKAKPDQRSIISGVFTSFGSLLGRRQRQQGATAGLLTLIGNMAKLGMTFADMRALQEALVDHMRAKAGDAFVDDKVSRAKAKIPLLGRFLD